MTFGLLPDSLSLFVNGERATTAPVVEGDPKSLGYVARNLILSPPASPADFDLGELMVFRHLLTPGDLAALDDYLGSAWSIPVRAIDGSAAHDPVRFATVEGILQSHGCTGCHYPMSPIVNVDLSTYEGVMATVVPGSPESSRLYLALDRMGQKPEASPLGGEEKQAIFDWIARGAKP